MLAGAVRSLWHGSTLKAWRSAFTLSETDSVESYLVGCRMVFIRAFSKVPELRTFSCIDNPTVPQWFNEQCGGRQPRAGAFCAFLKFQQTKAGLGAAGAFADTHNILLLNVISPHLNDWNTATRLDVWEGSLLTAQYVLKARHVGTTRNVWPFSGAKILVI